MLKCPDTFNYNKLWKLFSPEIVLIKTMKINLYVDTTPLCTHIFLFVFLIHCKKIGQHSTWKTPFEVFFNFLVLKSFATGLFRQNCSKYKKQTCDPLHNVLSLVG